MKYAYWLSITLFTVFRKVFGLVWYWIAVPFRAYARNVVYNYSLQNGKFLKRLLEREPKLISSKYMLKNVHGLASEIGRIDVRKISWIEYQLAFWLIWGWVDDDSNYDTFDVGHNETILRGERQDWLPGFVIRALINDNLRAKSTRFGNSFDLGDMREPVFGFWSALLWNTRNTAYNFDYMMGDTQDESKVFMWTIGKMQFGWKEAGMFNGKMTYRHIIGVNF